jgi:hypothetical protein
VKVAFVGVKRDYSQLSTEYVRMFNKYHLEIPFYYAELGGNDVTVTTTNYTGEPELFSSGGSFRNEAEQSYLGGHDHHRYDVIVHWRKFFPELYHKEAINVLHTCDHSYDPKWKQDVIEALQTGKLRKVICYKGWHLNNMAGELGLDPVQVQSWLTDELTFGVDPEIYKPAPNKDRYSMLWSSDPGRGMTGAVQLAVSLFQRDQRFRLHICHPDYVKAQPIRHPAIVWHGNVNNGPELWKLFNETGILPYTSTFREPSSRAARQSQCAGSLTLYPPNMGTPSEYVRDMDTGVMRPMSQWADKIVEIVSGPEYDRITSRAREQALSESWAVQADRFNKKFQTMLGETP